MSEISMYEAQKKKMEGLCEEHDLTYRFQKAKDKPGFKAKHEAELVIFEAARSTLLAMQDDEKLSSLKTLQAQQQRLLEEQQRLYDERAKLKKEVKQIETIKSNVDTFLAPSADHDRDHLRSTQRE